MPGNGSMAVALTVRSSERDVPAFVLVGGCPSKPWLHQKDVVNLQARRIPAAPISGRHIDSMSMPSPNKMPLEVSVSPHVSVFGPNAIGFVDRPMLVGFQA